MTALSPVISRYGNLVFMDGPIFDEDGLFLRRHPRMTRQHRAKIFAPFAALVGFDEHIRSKEVPYVDKHELDADEEWELNRRLGILRSLTYNSRVAGANSVTVSVEYYIPCMDVTNDAYGRKGLYQTVTGTVRRVDMINQVLVIADTSDSSDGHRYSGNIGYCCGWDKGHIDHTIAFSDIYEITDPEDQLFAPSKQ